MSKKKGRPPKEANLEKGEKVVEALSTTEVLDREPNEAYEGLTDRQQTIAKLRLRGMSQTVIANILNVSQPVISKECTKIKEHLQKRGAAIDQALTVGETASLYEEVELRAWELYSVSTDENTKIKSLALVMQAREKHTKLLFDLGRLERAGNKSQVEVTVSPLIQAWNEKQKQLAVEAVISSTLSKLPEPEPPPDDDIVDALLVDYDDQD